MGRYAKLVALYLTPVALVTGSLLSDVLAAVASVLLVALYLASLIAGWWPGFVVASVSSALALPVLFQPFLGGYSVLLALPAIVAASRGLMALAPVLLNVPLPTGRALSPLARSLVWTLVAVVLLSFILSVPVLRNAGGLVLAALALTAAVQSVRLGGRPLIAPVSGVAARAGERIEFEAEIRTVRIGARGFARISTDPGFSLCRGESFMLEDVGTAAISVAPALAGPTTVGLWAAITDSLGLLHVGQRLDVAKLNVVPRARAARWAAEGYLQHRAQGSEIGRMVSGQVAGFLTTNIGVEYQSSRMYVPGDSLVTVDWKHTARLQSLVVKTFDDGIRSSGLLLVSLSASSVDEADRLVYEVLSAALTISSMGHVASIGVYDHRGDSRLSPILDEDGLVREALGACGDVRVSPAWRRFSRPVSSQEMEARTARVRRGGSAAAAALGDLMSLSGGSLRRRVEASTVTSLLRLASLRYRPAWCIAVSSMHSDAEAILTGLRAMEHEGIRTKLVNVGDSSSKHVGQEG